MNVNVLRIADDTKMMLPKHVLEETHPPAKSIPILMWAKEISIRVALLMYHFERGEHNTHAHTHAKVTHQCITCHY